MGQCHFQGIHILGMSPANAPSPVPSRIFFNPWGFTTHAFPLDACFVGTWPLRFLGLELCPPPFPPPFSFLPSSSGLRKFIWCRASAMMGFTFTGHSRPFPPPSCLTSVLCTQWLCPNSCTFTVLDIYGSLSSHVRQFRPQDDLTALRCFPARRAGPPLGINPPVGYPVHAPEISSKQWFLRSGALLPRSFPRLLTLLRSGTQHVLLCNICTTGHLCPDVDTTVLLPA